MDKSNLPDPNPSSSSFEETMLQRSSEQGGMLTNLNNTNEEKLKKLNIIEKKVDILDKRVEHTNGTVRDLVIDMQVVKDRHKAEDKLRTDLIDILNKILQFLKKTALNIFWLVFTGVCMIIIIHIWNYIFPHIPFPQMPGING